MILCLKMEPASEMLCFFIKLDDGKRPQEEDGVR